MFILNDLKLLLRRLIQQMSCDVVALSTWGRHHFKELVAMFRISRWIWANDTTRILNMNITRINMNHQTGLNLKENVIILNIDSECSVMLRDIQTRRPTAEKCYQKPSYMKTHTSSHTRAHTHPSTSAHLLWHSDCSSLPSQTELMKHECWDGIYDPEVPDRKSAEATWNPLFLSTVIASQLPSISRSLTASGLIAQILSGAHGGQQSLINNENWHKPDLKASQRKCNVLLIID